MSGPVPALREPDALAAAGADSPLRFPAGGVRRSRYGYLDFVTDREVTAVLTEGCAHAMDASGRGVAEEYLLPWVHQEPTRRVLDVGCGLGMAARVLLEHRVDAWASDLPDAGAYWHASDAPTDRFLHADATAPGGLPFTDGAFDVVLSLGVIEHVGTMHGHCSLRPDYQQVRARFAAELLRVTAPGGRLLLGCPNKLFPVDVQHGPRDPSTPAPWRWPLFARTGLNVHKAWGRYHLLSAAELHRLFVTEGGARSSRSLPPGGFLGLSALAALPWLRVSVHSYLDALPAWARPTPLNPYTLVEIRT